MYQNNQDCEWNLSLPQGYGVSIQGGTCTQNNQDCEWTLTLPQGYGVSI